MRIQIEGREFNRMMKAVSPALESDTFREALQNIELRCDGEGHGCATALDGYMLSQFRFPCQGDKGVYFLRPIRPVPQDCMVEITKEDGKISISDGVTTITRSEFDSAYVNHKEICKTAQEGNPQLVMAFSPKLLKKMLKCCASGNTPVFLEMRAPGTAIVFQSGDVRGLVLPMRTSKKYEPVEFWGMEADA